MEELDIINATRLAFATKGYDITNIKVLSISGMTAEVQFKKVHWSIPSAESVGYTFKSFEPFALTN